MDNRDPRFEIAVAMFCEPLRKLITDVVMTNPEHDTSTRIRRTNFLIDKDCAVKYGIEPTLPLTEIIDEALQRVSVDLKEGFGMNVESVEMFDHQGRDWFADKVEQMCTTDHPWMKIVREKEEHLIVVSFGYGTVRARNPDGSISQNTVGVLPMGLAQLVDYNHGDEGVVVDVDSWDLQTNGVFVDPNVLKSFGRPE